MPATDRVPEKTSRERKIRTVHIDTSLQIERCKAPRKAKIVEQALVDFGFKSTSSYAKLEFKRAWLQRLAYLYSASQRVNRDEELAGYLDDRLGSHPGHLHRLKTCHQAIESFLSQISESLSPEARLIRLRSHIRNAILATYTWWTEHSVDHEFNGTGCARASEHPKQLPGGKIDVSIPQCRRNKINCTVHQFFEKKKEHFTAIKAEIEAHGDDASKELQEAKKIIKEAEKNPEYLCDDRICPKLGDILIAIDGLNMECFAANNDKEWTLLSEVLDKQLINPVREAKTAG